MAIDISLGSRYEDDAYFALPSGNVYVYGNTNLGGTALDSQNYWTKTQIAAGDASAYLMYVSPSLAQTVLGSKTFSSTTRFSADVSIGGNALIDGSISVSNNIKIGRDLTVGDDVSIAGKLHVGENTDISGDLSVVGNTSLSYLNASADVSIGDTLYVDTIRGSGTFVSGFTGSGFELVKDENGDYRMELDHLRVRGSLSAYEFIINKIRASNGSLWVSDAVEAVWPGDAETYIPAGLYLDTTKKLWYFYVDEGVNTLIADDAIRSQQFLGNSIHQYDWWVADSSGTQIWVYHDDYNQNDSAGPGGLSGTDVMGLVNIDADTLVDASDSPGRGYDFYADTDQEFRTDYFTIKGTGYINLGFDIDQTTPSGQLVYEVYNGIGTKISSGTYSNTLTNDRRDVSILIAGYSGNDPSCYILFRATGGGAAADGFYIDTVKDFTMDGSLDVTGYTFVRMGSSSNVSRQGSLYLTASDTNSPYLEVLDGMTDHNISNDDRKVRLGKLSGLSWNDTSIGGYGLWSSNAYLDGGINANYGSIGNFTIEDGLLKGESGGNLIILDPDNTRIQVTDSSGSIIAEFTNEDIKRLDEIAEGTEISYTGADAGNNTKYKLDAAGTGYVSCPSLYTQNLYTYTGGGALEVSTGLKTADYWITTTENVRYTVNAYLNIDVSVGSAPDSSVLEYDWYSGGDVPVGPYPTSHDEYILTHFYSIDGTWSADTSVYIYDASSLLVRSFTAATPTELSGDYNNWKIINNATIDTLDESTYIVIKPRYNNQFVATDYMKVFVSKANPLWPYEGPQYVWDPIPADEGYYGDLDVSVSFTSEYESLTMNGRFQITQIGQDGLITYWDDNKYFTVNSGGIEAGFGYVIGSAGDWRHVGNMKIEVPTDSGSDTGYGLKIIQDGYSGTINVGMLAVAKSDADDFTWIGSFQDSNYSANEEGILIKCGSTGSAGGVPIRFWNGNTNNTVGYIYHNGTATYYYGYIDNPSDEKFKKNIIELEKSSDKIKALNPRRYNLKDNDEGDIGFVAQELKEVIPEAVRYRNRGGKGKDDWSYSIDPTKLIPHLVKSLQEALERIEELEAKVSKIK